MFDIIPNWHPIWVHFVIALPVSALVLWTAARLWSNWQYAGVALTVARWNLWAGALMMPVVLITGYLAANSVMHDDAGHDAMARHALAAWTAASLTCAAALLAWWSYRRPRLAWAPWSMLVVAVLSLGVTGHLGAENVYRHGLGVERLPDPGQHSHGTGHSENSAQTGDHGDHDNDSNHRGGGNHRHH